MENIVEVINLAFTDPQVAEVTKNAAIDNQSSPGNGNFYIPGLDLEMIWIKPGSFMMGSPKREAKRVAIEIQHRVTLTDGFWLAKYPVLQSQWKSLMNGENPSCFKGYEDCDSLPVESVSWDDCQKFIGVLNGDQEFLKCLPDGCQYRLPTEAEWEYACRAGTKSPYNGPNQEPLSELGWFEGNSSYTIHPVGKLLPNSWGLYDMHGNVWEWCQDGFCEYGTGPETNPSDPDHCQYRIIRGGSWICSANFCRSAIRWWNEPGERNDQLGFRLAAGPVIQD